MRKQLSSFGRQVRLRTILSAQTNQTPEDERYQLLGVFRNGRDNTDLNLYLGFARMTLAGSVLGLLLTADEMFGGKSEKLKDKAISDLRNVELFSVTFARAQSKALTAHYQQNPEDFVKVKDSSEHREMILEMTRKALTGNHLTRAPIVVPAGY